MPERSSTASPAAPGAVQRALEDKAAAELGSDREARASLLARIGSALVGGLALGALVLSGCNVALRYFQPAWTLELSDEVQVYLVVWAVMLALGSVTLADQHVKADLFLSGLPQRLRSAAALFGELLGLTFALLLLWYGARAAYGSWDYGDVSTTSLRFPLWIYVAALPAGALSLALAYSVRITRRLKAARR